MPFQLDLLLGMLDLLQRLLGADETGIGLVDIVYDGDGVVVRDGFELLERHHPVVVDPLQPLVAAMHVVEPECTHAKQQYAEQTEQNGES